MDGDLVKDRLDPADLAWDTLNWLSKASMTRDTDGDGRPDGYTWTSASGITRGQRRL